MTKLKITDWLVEQALPVWARTGVDAAGGGFFEKIDLAGRAVEAPRRTRVVARHIYVFSTAARRGWLPEADALVEHGLQFLLGRLRMPDGSFAASVRADGAIIDGSFDLYEQAFVLFALASARIDRPDREPLRRQAEALLGRLRTGWAHPAAGFEEGAPRRLPLLSNPHMHLFEAALEWLDISDGPQAEVWEALATEIAGLCMARFIAADSGALRENFDGDWQTAPGVVGERVEPGHQFEWAWLLMRWARRTRSSEILGAARRLLEIGEADGVDPDRGVAVNALGRGLAVVDAHAKVWPQTERIKAWCAAAVDGNAAQVTMAPAKIEAAIAGLTRFFLASPAGLWHEDMTDDGRFSPTDCRASSLYHIVCAIDTWQRAAIVADRRAA